jgi:hypothetical protein
VTAGEALARLEQTPAPGSAPDWLSCDDGEPAEIAEAGHAPES